MFKVLFGEYEDEYSLGEFETEREAFEEIGRYCLNKVKEYDRMPDPVRIVETEET